MHLIVAVVVTAIVGGGAGYACRGWIKRELVASKSDLTAFAGRLEAAAKKDFASLQADVLTIASDIRKKIS